MTTVSEAGGFLVTTLPSPPPSSGASTAAAPSILPQPRNAPLKPGSAKESSIIDYVDKKLLGISRRYEKRFNADFEDEAASEIEGRGYERFGEVAKDLEDVIDVVWISGTPSLEIPYLLTIALTCCADLPSFPFDPRPTFHLLHKLDLAFYSLLRGTNSETGEILPGFEGGRGKVSTTEKVRMRGLVERTRVAVVEVAGKAGMEVTGLSGLDEGLTTTDDDDEMEGMEGARSEVGVEGNHGRWEMEVARVYEKTIVELGMSLDTGMGVID
ncbi:hypothetical protein MMC21_000619 [Puttea exsequens]|nr:hypothetical protein [Puttea exsequens]